MDLDWAHLQTAALNNLKKRLTKFETRVASAAVGNDLIPLHAAAAAIGASLRDVVDTGNTRLKNAADKLERALATSTSGNVLPFYDAATVIVTGIKVAIDAAEAPLQDAVNDLDKVINSVVNVVDTVVAAAETPRNDPTFALAQGSIKAFIALMDVMSEITRASTSIPLTPVRVVAGASTSIPQLL